MFIRSTTAIAATFVVLGALGLAGCRGGGSEAELTESAKEYIQNFGSINANDVNTTLKPLTLTISGNRYTIQ